MKYLEGVRIHSLVIIALIIFSFILSYISIFSARQFGIVDPQALIAAKASELAVQYPNAKVPQDKLQTLVDHLKEEIASFASEKNLILISKTAVLGGDLPDYTEILLQRLKAEEQ